MPRGGDPTAAAARRNLEAEDKYGALILPGPRRIWIDRATAKTLFELLAIKPMASCDDHYGRIKENAPEIAGTIYEGK